MKTMILLPALLVMSACDAEIPDPYLMSLRTEYGSPDNCECAALKYESDLSDVERGALLQATGNLFLGKGWVANTAARRQMTVSIMNKWQNASIACGVLK